MSISLNNVHNDKHHAHYTAESSRMFHVPLVWGEGGTRIQFVCGGSRNVRTPAPLNTLHKHSHIKMEEQHTWLCPEWMKLWLIMVYSEASISTEHMNYMQKQLLFASQGGQLAVVVSPLITVSRTLNRGPMALSVRVHITIIAH